MDKRNLQPGWNIDSPIPYIVLGVSVDTFYNFHKNYHPGFNWSFVIMREELYDVESEVMDFLKCLNDKNMMGRVQLKLQCKKVGEIVESVITLEYVRIAPDKMDGWIIGDTY